MKSKEVKTIAVVIYFLFGLYFLNFVFAFVVIPEYVSNFSDWINIASAILLFIGGVNFVRAGNKGISI